MSVTNPKITTEWEDLQVKYGNFIAPKKEETNEEKLKKFLEVAENVDVLEYKNVEQLEELIDESKNQEEEDELQIYRKKRLEELKNKAKLNRFGEVIHLAKDSFIEQVTNASKECVGTVDECFEENDDSREKSKITKTNSGTYVVVHMYFEHIDLCQKMNKILSILATKFKNIKFTKGIAPDVVPGYPPEKCPTILLYFGGTCRAQIVGADEWGGKAMTAEKVEYVLGTKYKILETDVSIEEVKSEGGRKGKIIRYVSANSKECEKKEDESDEEHQMMRGKGYMSVKLDSKMKKNY